MYYLWRLEGQPTDMTVGTYVGAVSTASTVNQLKLAGEAIAIDLFSFAKNKLDGIP
jgi:hypothetical protein